LNNFLQSGFDFTDEEAEIRSKFVLMNSMVSIGIVAMFIFILFLFLNGESRFAAAGSFFVFFGLYLLYALRRTDYELKDMKKSEKQKSTKPDRTDNHEMHEDTEDLIEKKAHFEHLANHDALTGLPNRKFFLDRLEDSIDKAKRSNAEFAVFFIDLDHFKEINDTMGHQVGDEVLRIVSERLQNQLRTTDCVARLGGDEFTILLEELKEIYDAEKFASKLTAVLREPILINNHEHCVTSSIGIGIYPNDGSDAETLLKCADTAMYGAKHSGRNAHQFYTKDMTEAAYERLMMETGFQRALEKEEFVLYYHPLINSQTGQLIGLEALIRWEHPEMGMMLPMRFLPFVESTGLIIPLGEWVLRTAAMQMVEWQKKGFNPGLVSINVSVKQLSTKGFVTMLEKVLHKTKCNPKWIELEIMEDYPMQNPDLSIELLQKIKKVGVGVSLDDFGTGYTSLAYLKHLPIDKLKIDKSFISNIPGNSEDEKLVKTIISMAKNLGLDVLGEGVETKEQKLFLQEAGCNNIQGYLYGKPMSVREVTRMFERKIS
ncbi:MAG: EAL domain-containing protein, partial [Campylobacterota bacterium]|nr:EAL domain-containing protein [Campylobacterota bacterium]